MTKETIIAEDHIDVFQIANVLYLRNLLASLKNRVSTDHNAET